MEPFSAALVTFGIAILLASWIMLIVDSFNQDYTWGLCSIFLPPLAYFYALCNWSKAAGSLTFAVIGWFLIILA